MTDRITRLGLLYPPGGGEYEYYQVAESLDYRLRPYTVCVRLAGGDHSHAPEALTESAQIPGLAFTASTLAPLRPDAAMWACTSASFFLGRAHAEAQRDAIAAAAGCPASSTSLAFVDALRALGLDRVAVVATYPRHAAEAFERFLGEFDITVSATECFDAPGGWASFGLPPASVVEAARRIDGAQAQAILVPDTAMPGFPVLRALEPEVGKPVLTANQVTLWKGLRLAGNEERLPGFGRLLEER